MTERSTSPSAREAARDLFVARIRKMAVEDNDWEQEYFEEKLDELLAAAISPPPPRAAESALSCHICGDQMHRIWGCQACGAVTMVSASIAELIDAGEKLDIIAAQLRDGFKTTELARNAWNAAKAKFWLATQGGRSGRDARDGH